MREGETYGSWVWAAESPRGATDQDGRVPKSAAQSLVGLKYPYASRPWSPVAEATHNRAQWYSPEADLEPPDKGPLCQSNNAQACVYMLRLFILGQDNS